MGQALALHGQERRVGSNEDDDRARGRRNSAVGIGHLGDRDRLADGHSVHAQAFAAAMVRLNEDADHGAAGFGDHA